MTKLILNRRYPDLLGNIIRLVALLLLAVVVISFFGQAAFAQGSSPSEVIRVDNSRDSSAIKRRSLTAEVGDSSQLSFDYSFKLSAWDGEVFMRVSLQDQERASTEFVRIVTLRSERSRTRLLSNSYSHDIYYVEKRQLSDSTALGVDSVTRRVLEWEILLHEKPASNRFISHIESDDLIFYYQPFLTEQECQRGTFRADWAQDCYAVYHATARGRAIRPDSTTVDYRTGKAFTIERPKAWDAAGDTVWCVVRVDTVASTMTITVPQSFIDRAAYPITIDPSFGDNDEANGDGWDTSIYDASAAGNRDGNYQYTASSGDVLDSIAIYGKYVETFNLAVYSASSTVPSSFVDSTAQLTGTTDGSWVKGAVTAGASLAGGTTYTICCGNASGGFRCTYDNATNGLSVENGGSLNSSWSESHTWGYRYAMYADYHNSGGGAPPLSSRRRTIITGGK